MGPRMASSVTAAAIPEWNGLPEQREQALHQRGLKEKPDGHPPDTSQRRAPFTRAKLTKGATAAIAPGGLLCRTNKASLK